MRDAQAEAQCSLFLQAKPRLSVPCVEDLGTRSKGESGWAVPFEERRRQTDAVGDNFRGQCCLSEGHSRAF